jgi:hypothetical protein
LSILSIEHLASRILAILRGETKKISDTKHSTFFVVQFP